jgi:hypothetical protein
MTSRSTPVFVQPGEPLARITLEGTRRKNEFRTSAVIVVAICRIAHTAFEYEDHVFAWHFLVDISPEYFSGGFITEIA